MSSLSSWNSVRCCPRVQLSNIMFELTECCQTTRVKASPFFFDNAFKSLRNLTLILSVNIRFLIASSSCSVSMRKGKIYGLFITLNVSRRNLTEPYTSEATIIDIVKRRQIILHCFKTLRD